MDEPPLPDCEPLFVWSTCSAEWHAVLPTFYLVQGCVFAAMCMVSLAVLYNEMKCYGTSLRLMILHYLSFVLLLMKVAVVMHAAIMYDSLGFGFDGAVVRLLHFMPYGFAYVACITLLLFWLDHYFFVRSAGAEPRWLRHLRLRLLVMIIAINAINLVQSVVQNRYRQWDRQFTISM
jgi:hypothetical protein